LTSKIHLHGKRGRKLVLLIDDADYLLIYRMRPYMGSEGYPMVYREGSAVPVHLVVMRVTPEYLKENKLLVDHIDLNRLNAQSGNLRLVTASQNMQNKAPKGKYKGVTKRGNKFVARIYHNLEEVYLGSFNTEEQAADAYNTAAIEYYGDGARINDTQISAGRHSDSL